MSRQPTKRAIASATGGSGYSDVLINFPCRITAVLVETDGTNDPTVTIRDNTAASGDAAFPAVTFDASALGLNGARGLDHPMNTAVHVVITCAGAAKLFIYYL